MKLQVFILFCILQLIYGSRKSKTPLSFRIFGSDDAPDGIAPYMSSVQRKESHNCGGSIISKRWILTAAHCVHSKLISEMSVVVGTNCLKEGGTRYAAEEYIWHPHYQHGAKGFGTQGNDIALIRVKGNIEFNDRVQPIAYSSEEFPDDVEAQFTGWGRIEQMAEPTCLQLIHLKAHTNERCKKTSLGPMMDRTHICTFSKKGRGACHGDSGGPLVWNNTVIGIANFVKPCALGYPDVFAKTSHFYSWIKRNTK